MLGKNIQQFCAPTNDNSGAGFKQNPLMVGLVGVIENLGTHEMEERMLVGECQTDGTVCVENVYFDGPIEGIVVAFYPEWPDPSTSADWLWWTLTMDPATVGAVIDYIRAEALSVDTILIGGADFGRNAGGSWVRLLVRCALAKDCPPVIVDTGGLNPRCRRRIIDATRRQANLARRRRDRSRWYRQWLQWLR